MYFLKNDNIKVIFGWSAKCGCTHVKKLFYYLQNNENQKLHTQNDINSLPKNINEYTTILIVRNPYERILSGFLDKYQINGEFRKKWRYKKLTFSLFINELVSNKYRMIDTHHFIPQTQEHFNKSELLRSKKLIIYDINNINYDFIEKIYNKKIPEHILNFKGEHIRKYKEENSNFDKVYDLEMSEYFDYKISIDKFYNTELRDKVYNFYIDDFNFFKEHKKIYELHL